MAGSLYPLPAVVVREIWQMTSEEVQKAGLDLQARETPQTWTLAPPVGKEKEAISTWSVVLQDQQKTYKLKNSTTKGARKVEQVYS